MTALKIFFACALGAFIGALVALQLAPPLWWLGALAGFAAGYLSYEPRKVYRALRIAWKEVFGWKPNVPLWKLWGAIFASMASTASMWLAILFLAGASSVSNGNASARGLFEFYGFAGFFVCVFFPTLIAIMIGADALPTQYSNLQKRAMEFFFEFHPVSVAYRGIKKLFKAALKIPRFLRKVFILIHSEIRLLCGVDAAIGAGIGYFAGNALIGALAGGILGILNYYLVSVKLLKLVPGR